MRVFSLYSSPSSVVNAVMLTFPETNKFYANIDIYRCVYTAYAHRSVWFFFSSDSSIGKTGPSTSTTATDAWDNGPGDNRQIIIDYIQYRNRPEMALIVPEESQRPYRFGMTLVCIGALFNWLGLADHHTKPVPAVRYIGVGLVASGAVLICMAMCFWMNSVRDDEDDVSNITIQIILSTIVFHVNDFFNSATGHDIK